MLTRLLLQEGHLCQPGLVVIDAGARGGIETHWHHYGSQATIIAFEPDEQECKRLRRAHAEHPVDTADHRYYPFALAAVDGTATLNVTRMPDSSSLLDTNSPFTSRFGMGHNLEHTASAGVRTVTLDNFLEREKLPAADFVKLDIEGSELAALEGARRTLESAILGLSVEVWFAEEHVARPLFSEVDSYLRAQDFALFDLRDLTRWRRITECTDRSVGWIGSGQLMYAQALYFKDLPALQERGKEVSRAATLKLASLAEVFCYTDFAREVLRSGHSAGALSTGEERRLVAALDSMSQRKGTVWRRLARRMLQVMIPPSVRWRAMQAIQGILNE